MGWWARGKDCGGHGSDLVALAALLVVGAVATPALAGAAAQADTTESQVGGGAASHAERVPQSRAPAHVQLAPAATIRFADPSGDAVAGGMDITNVTVSNEGARLTFVIEIPTHETLPPAKFIAVGLDTDRNLGTGNHGGLEYRLWVDGTQSTIQLDRWGGSGWVGEPPGTLTGSYARGETIGVDATAFGNPSSFDFVVETYGPGGNTLEDSAPNQGRYRFSLVAQNLNCFGSPATGPATDGPDVLIGTTGNDTLDGLGGDDKICGLEGTDTLVGGAGNDSIDGGSETDAIVGGLGDDHLFGGAGIDIVAFLDNAVGVQVNFAAGTARGAGADTLHQFEALAGSPHADRLEGDAGTNFLFPYGGNDTIRGAGGVDFILFQLRTQANLATGRATGEGNIRFTGIEGLAGEGRLIGNAGPNFLMGSKGRDRLDGGGGDDTLLGLAGDDRILGGAGVDFVDGGPGNDTMDGGAGDQDLASYLNVAARVNVNLASRRASGDGTDTLRAFEVVAGSRFDDVLRGDAGSNTLQGKAGNDRIDGAAGDDFLDGGGDSDSLTGGAGSDYCLDGERLAGCESRSRSPASSRSSSRTTARPDAGLRVERPATGTALDSLLAWFSGPAAIGAGTATGSGDDVQYSPAPACIADRGSGPVSTSIAPPRWVRPYADASQEQTAEWQGLLMIGKRVVFRTPRIQAVIAGPQHPSYGYPVIWQRGGRTYRKQPQSVTRSDPAHWEAELRIVPENLPATRHVVAPPEACPRPSK